MSENDELRQIAEHLLILAQRRHNDGDVQLPGHQEHTQPLQRRTNNDPISFADPDTLASLAASFYETRRLRDRHFNPELFADPAWDILLDLFVQKSAGRRVSITSVCIAASVPPTTALRWLTVLGEEGLIIREEDEADRRRAFLRLSQKGETAVQRTLIDSLAYLRAGPARMFTFQRGRL